MCCHCDGGGGRRGCAATAGDDVFELVLRSVSGGGIAGSTASSVTAMRQLIAAVGAERYRFNARNASGRWRLNLERKAHRELLRLLGDVAQREEDESEGGGVAGVAAGEKAGHSLGPGGAWRRFRHCTLDGTAVEVSPALFECVPRGGLLVVDYISSRRPPAIAEPICEQQLLRELRSIGIDDELSRGGAAGGPSISVILLQLHLLASYRYFTCEQVRFIADKIVDLEQFKLVRDALTDRQFDDVVGRVGWIDEAAEEGASTSDRGGDDDKKSSNAPQKENKKNKRRR